MKKLVKGAVSEKVNRKVFVVCIMCIVIFETFNLIIFGELSSIINKPHELKSTSLNSTYYIVETI